MNIKMVFNQNGNNLQEIMFQNIQQLVDTEMYLTHPNNNTNGLESEYIQDEKSHIRNKHIEMR